MVLTVDGEVPGGTLKEIERIDGVMEVKMIRL
jgi:hypothetical protein